MSTPNALERIYGEAADVQQARYTAALATFARIYGPGPVHAFRAPGRVNLIGEHTDYNGGFVLPVALDRDVLLLARPRPDLLVRLHNVEPDFAPHTFTIGPTIPSAPHGDWSNYVRGAAQMVAQSRMTDYGLRITDFALRITDYALRQVHVCAEWTRWWSPPHPTASRAAPGEFVVGADRRGGAGAGAP